MWYAVKTKPGAQMPQREYAVETTRSRKGYRIVPSLNANLSAVERALSDAGFTHYMPAEKRLIRDRRHTNLWKPRRFALLVGYVFVRGPLDFLALEGVSGVEQIVKVQGVPMPVDLLDILTLRSMEAVAEEQFDRMSEIAYKTLRSKAKNDPRLRSILHKLGQAADLVPSLQMVRQRAA